MASRVVKMSFAKVVAAFLDKGDDMYAIAVKGFKKAAAIPKWADEVGLNVALATPGVDEERLLAFLTNQDPGTIRYMITVNAMAENFTKKVFPADLNGEIDWDNLEVQDIILTTVQSAFPVLAYVLMNFVDDDGNIFIDLDDLPFGPTIQTVWSPCFNEYGSDVQAKTWCEEIGGFIGDKWEKCGGDYTRKMCHVPLDMPAGSTKVYTPCTTNETARAANFKDRNEMNDDWCKQRGGISNNDDYIDCGGWAYRNACFIPQLGTLSDEQRKKAVASGVRGYKS